MTKFPIYKKVETEKLIPYARNSRTHSADQINKIAASIQEFGFLNPIIIDGDNGIIAGHGRVLAAQKLGMGELPVIEAKHLTEAQKRAYVIADNRLALDAGWDDEMLRVEFDELADLGFDLTLTGFTLAEVDALGESWDSDIDVTEKHGENLDGISTFLKLKIDPDDETQAKEVLTNALDQAGVEYEWA